MPFNIELTKTAHAELENIRLFDRRRIVGAIERHLIHETLVRTRNRKPLPEIRADFEYVPPVWELRVGDYRVFYDVDELLQTVFVRAVRLKPAGMTTEDIVREKDSS